ncbi:piggyBac transposable element-derived protein 3-like [Armigeres subalbatus]|uniref:piggyBac transposable element-derived protein 3-like n=1 Tax=Armigeres subalbatus TaxID=124917 RepID=UPI002ED2D29E
MSESEDDFLGFSEDESECLIQSLEITKIDEISDFSRRIPCYYEIEHESDEKNMYAIQVEGDESEVDFLSESEDDERECFVPKPVDPTRFCNISNDEPDGINQSATISTSLAKSKTKRSNKSSAKISKRTRVTTRKTASKKKGRFIKWHRLNNDEREAPFCPMTLPVPPAKAVTPYQYFKRFFTDAIIQNITEQTNLYSEQKLGDGNSIDVTKHEIEQFLGILVLMGIHKVPSYRMNWATATRYAPIADVMTRNRFEQIKNMLHFNDNTQLKKRNEPGYDKLFKVRPFIDAIRLNFLDVDPLPDQSIDEIMIPSKSHSPLRQYNKNKPHRFGINVKGRAGKDGILHDFDIYTGKSDKQPNGDWGISGDVVLNLVKTLPENQQIRIFADNWFSSYSLAHELNRRGFQYTGTIRVGRIPNADFIPDKELMAKGRGSHDAYISNDNIII